MPCRAFEGMHARYNERAKAAASLLGGGSGGADVMRYSDAAGAAHLQQERQQEEKEETEREREKQGKEQHRKQGEEKEQHRKQRPSHHLMRPSFWSNKVSSVHLYQSMAFYVRRRNAWGLQPQQTGRFASPAWYDVDAVALD